MPRTCTVCRHPDRGAIDAAVIVARESFRALATSFQVSSSALRRHKLEHVPASLAIADASSKVLQASSVLDYLRALQARCDAIYKTAESQEDYRTALIAVREQRAIVDLVARLAERDASRIDSSIFAAHIQKVIDVFYEFVPSHRVDAAIDRLTQLTEVELRRSGTSAT